MDLQETLITEISPFKIVNIRDRKHPIPGIESGHLKLQQDQCWSGTDEIITDFTVQQLSSQTLACTKEYYLVLKVNCTQNFISQIKNHEKNYYKIQHLFNYKN